MKVGYVVGIFPAETETFICREVEGVKQAGIKVRVFALKRPGQMIAAALLSPDTIVGTEYARPDRAVSYLFANVRAALLHPLRYLSALSEFVRAACTMPFPAFARLLYHFSWGIGIARSAERDSITHLHCHFGSACNAGLAAHLYSGITFSFTAHASADIFVTPTLLALKVERAARIVAVCRYSRRYLDSVTGFSHSAKLTTIYNGIDPSEPSTMSPALAAGSVAAGEDATPFRLVSVGSLNVAKGFATLIEVCRELRSEGHAVTCRIIGEGSDRALLERRVTDAGLQGSVELTGALPTARVYSELRGADAFVLLSEIGVNGFRDGFPTVILEAMAMALPVVSTWVSGIPELVEHGHTGLLVPERDSAAASAAVRRLMADRTAARRMGREGRERVTKLFNFQRSIGALSDLLVEVAGRNVPAERAAAAGGDQ